MCLFETLSCDALAAVHTCCRFLLRAIVQCEEKLTISASWAKDEDISRLLQSLPNWANMAQPRQTRPKREDEEDFTRYVHEKTRNTGKKQKTKKRALLKKVVMLIHPRRLGFPYPHLDKRHLVAGMWP